MSVLKSLVDISSKRPMHLTLIDPDAQAPKKGAEIAEAASYGGTDGIMIGGSVGISQYNLDTTIKKVKEKTSLPVILFPGDVSGVSEYADAIFFMSLLNSRNPYYITGAQALGASTVKKSGIESIPMGYLVIEPGGTVGFIGDAKLIPRKKADIAVAYSLAAQYMGMRVIYLEAGSGAEKHVPSKMIRAVRHTVDIPVIVGGGIRNKEHAYEVAKSGADIIVTGTIVEEVSDVKTKIGEIAQSLKRARD